MRKIDPLQEVKAILKELAFRLEQRKGIWKQLQANNPNFPQLSEMHWKEMQNNSWIRGASKIEEINALENWGSVLSFLQTQYLRGGRKSQV